MLLATDKPVLVAPAMNVRMWQHPATQRNLATLRADGVVLGRARRGPDGLRRIWARPHGRAGRILDADRELAASKRQRGPLTGRRVRRHGGPTHEPIDPVRYIANRSSGKQGHAIAARRRRAGRRGDAGQRARSRCPNRRACAGAGRDGARDAGRRAGRAAGRHRRLRRRGGRLARRPTKRPQKLKKQNRCDAPTLALAENPDILATIAERRADRPALVIGFAAETENLIENAQAKRARKGSDWIIANDVWPGGGVMGGDRTQVHLVTAGGVEDWPDAEQGQAAARLLLALPRRSVSLRAAAEWASASRVAAPAARRRPAVAVLSIADAAGLDLRRGRAPEQPVELEPGERALVPTGFASRCRPATRRRSARALGLR